MQNSKVNDAQRNNEKQQSEQCTQLNEKQQSEQCPKN